MLKKRRKKQNQKKKTKNKKKKQGQKIIKYIYMKFAEGKKIGSFFFFAK